MILSEILKSKANVVVMNIGYGKIGMRTLSI